MGSLQSMEVAVVVAAMAMYTWKKNGIPDAIWG